MPSPEQIKAACWEIKKTWSPEEEKLRAGWHYEPAKGFHNVAEGFICAKLSGPDVGRQRRNARNLRS